MDVVGIFPQQTREKQRQLLSSSTTLSTLMTLMHFFGVGVAAVIVRKVFPLLPSLLSLFLALSRFLIGNVCGGDSHFLDCFALVFSGEGH